MTKRVLAALSVAAFAFYAFAIVGSLDPDSSARVLGSTVSRPAEYGNGNGNAYGQDNRGHGRPNGMPAQANSPNLSSSTTDLTTAPSTTTAMSVETTTTASIPSAPTTTTLAPAITSTTGTASTTAAPTSTTAVPTTATTVLAGFVVIAPGNSIQEAINRNPAGTSFLLKAGVHTGSRLTPKDGQRFVGEEGAIISGMDSAELAFVGNATNVVIDNLIIEHFASAPQFGAIHAVGSGWQIRNSEFRYNAGAGLSFWSGWTVTGNYIHHNQQIGLLAYTAVGSVVENNEIAFNNYSDRFAMTWAAGGAKFVKTQGLVVRDNYVHDNHGAGLWTDGSNIDTLYERNTAINNYGPGILHEISYRAIIRNNRVEGNAFKFYVGGILVTESSNVEIYGNSVSGNDGGIVGIQDANRGSGDYGAYRLENLFVHDNVMSYQQGWTGVRDNVGDGAVYGWSNRYEGNTYTVPANYKGWYWVSELLWPNWTALGHDS